MAKSSKDGTPKKGSSSVSLDSPSTSSASPRKDSHSSPRKRHITDVSWPALDSSSHVSDSQSDNGDSDNVSNEVLSIAKKISKRLGGKRQKVEEWTEHEDPNFQSQTSTSSSQARKTSPRKQTSQNARPKSSTRSQSEDEDSDSAVEPSQWRPETNTRSPPSKSSSDSDLFNSESESSNIVKDTGAKKTSARRTAKHDVSSDSSNSDSEACRPDPTPTRNTSRNISKEPRTQSSAPRTPGKNTKLIIAVPSVSNPAPKPLKLRFQCPASYSVRPFSPSALTLEDVKDQDVDLWLIKAPKKVDMGILDNQEALMNGSVALKKESSKSGTTFLWDLNCQQDAETAADSASVLLPSRKDSNLHFAGEVKGYVQLTKSVQTSPYVIPQVAPKSRHQLPAGLKLRHQPFGADTPVVSSSDKKHKRMSKSRDSIDGDSFAHTPKSKKKKKKHRRETE